MTKSPHLDELGVPIMVAADALPERECIGLPTGDDESKLAER